MSRSGEHTTVVQLTLSLKQLSESDHADLLEQMGFQSNGKLSATDGR